MAQTKTTNQTTNDNATRRRYEVTGETATILDCMTEVSNLYTHIYAILEERYGIAVDNYTEPYFKAVDSITDMLTQELNAQIAGNLSELANLRAAVTKI